jgi:hypothetical protein
MFGPMFLGFTLSHLQCSGQSNMEAMVDVTFARNESYAAADAGNYSDVRMFQIPWRPMANATYILPRSSSAHRPTQIHWEAPSSTTLPAFSAECWYACSMV